MGCGGRRLCTGIYKVEQERRNTQERPTPRDGRVRDLPWTAEHRRSGVLATTSRRRRRSRVQRGAVIGRLRPSTYHACRARQSGGPVPASYTIFTSRLASAVSWSVKRQEPLLWRTGLLYATAQGVDLEADPFRGIQDRRTTCRKQEHAETPDPRSVGKTHGEEGAEPRDAQHAREPGRCVRAGKPGRLAEDDGSSAALRRDAHALGVPARASARQPGANRAVGSDAPTGACSFQARCGHCAEKVGRSLPR